jgi:hypothetical protein
MAEKYDVFKNNLLSKRVNTMRNLVLKISAFVLVGACAAVVSSEINFGADTSRYANDGECDDPRFAGAGMAQSYAATARERDATDCAEQFELGRVRLIRTRAEWDVAQCSAIDFGGNSSKWANDDECDDPRFTGPGAHPTMLSGDEQSDARDCSRLCASGQVWLR